MKLKIANEIFTQSEIEQLRDQLHTTDIQIDASGLIAKYPIKAGSIHYKKLYLSLVSKKLVISSFTGHKPQSLFSKVDQAINADLGLILKMQVIVPITHQKCSICGTWNPPGKVTKTVQNELVCDVCAKAR